MTAAIKMFALEIISRKKGGGKRMSNTTVSAGYFSALLNFAVASGAAKNALLERAEVKQEDLSDPDNRLPFESYIALTHTSKELCDNPALPLHLGAHENFNEISVVGLLCYSAPTMREALKQLNRFGYLVAELDVPLKDGRFQIVRDTEGTWLEDTRLNPNDFPELTEETWARFIAETQRSFPDQPFVKSVHVTHSEPSHSAKYKSFMQAPVIFNSDKNAMLIHESWLSIPLNTPNAYVLGILSAHAQKLLQSLQESKTIRAQVESLLIPILHNGDCGMEPIAAELGLSRQTLYRKLKAENISYENLLDELRHKMALHYLNGKKVSVNETAYLVGFSDPSSFSRAFKRWTGSSPSSQKPRTTN
jgi:AraC-like DNA-binding protein